MTPPVEVFPAFELPSRVQVTTKGKRRKDNIDLEKCELLQIMQYECNIQDTKVRDSPIICEPIQRLFRRYGLDGCFADGL
jgi:hypothetical protein